MCLKTSKLVGIPKRVCRTYTKQKKKFASKLVLTAFLFLFLTKFIIFSNFNEKIGNILNSTKNIVVNTFPLYFWLKITDCKSWMTTKRFNALLFAVLMVFQDLD